MPMFMLELNETTTCIKLDKKPPKHMLVKQLKGHCTGKLAHIFSYVIFKANSQSREIFRIVIFS